MESHTRTIVSFNILLTILAILSTSYSSQAQTIYHLNAINGSIYSKPDSKSPRVQRVYEYQNFTEIDTVNTEWAQVRIYNTSKIGFIKLNLLKKGKAVVTQKSTGIRIGATCKDGTSSRAKGRGACSHHGGVRNWKYSTRKEVKIIDG